jgi:hypothetical protein
MRISGLIFIIVCCMVGMAHAQPAMPPLCTVRAEVVDRNDDDSTLQLKILEVHGLFATLSCEDGLPEQGDTVRTLAVWEGDFAGIVPGCVLSAGVAPEDASVPDTDIKWKDVVAECPDSKKMFQYPLLTEGNAD